jgi:hypothetical protein
MKYVFSYKNIVFIHVPEEVAENFRIIGFSNIFTIEEDLARALVSIMMEER